MNTLGRWFHIIQKVNRYNEFNNLELARRGMAGLAMVYSLHNCQQTRDFRFHNEGVLLDCASVGKLHGDKRTLNAQGIKCFSKLIFNASQLEKSLVMSKSITSYHGSTMHPFKQTLRKSHNLSREWLAQLWLEEKKMKKLKCKRHNKHCKSARSVDSPNYTLFNFFGI